MRPLLVVVLASCLLGAPTLAHAQDSLPPSAVSPGAAPSPVAPPPPPPASEPPPPPASEPPPPAAPWDALPPLSSGEEKPQDHPGFAMNVSFGYAIPAGNATGAPGDSLSASFTGQFPFSLEMGGNVTPSLFVGAYGTYALGGVASEITVCQAGSGVSCSAYSLRTGIAIAYRFLPGAMIRPWVGYGIGYEWQNISLTDSATGASGSLSIKGWEFGHFKAGFDVQASPTFGVGPFVDLGVGQYGHTHSDNGAQSSDADITTTALHEWFTVGVRASFAP
jgi:hypothetical protein